MKRKTMAARYQRLNMRRKNRETSDEKAGTIRSNTNRMPLSYLKIVFGLVIFVSVAVYIYLYIRTPKLPFPMSPEMEAIYVKHGPGEAKPRRRPDINDAVKENHGPVTTTAKTLHDQAIHAGIVACGQRAPEAIISLKSFAMLSEKPLYFHVFAEDELHDTFKKEIQTWPGSKNGKIKLDLHTIQFPVEGNFHEWKKLFKPCASQRLFFPLLLKDVDSIIYVDTDVLMLRPPEDLWGFFSRFNSTQLAGMAPEGEVDAIGWYNRFARHPYYGRLGVNSGVMLMNLTRMRRINWNDDVYPIYKHYRYDITWGDQDILNIMFHFKPEHLYIFPCEWNYRPDHCMYGNNCGTALNNGVSVVHGNRGVFQNDKQPEFKAIYKAFENTNFGVDMKKTLKNRIKMGLEKFKNTYCGENGYIFSKKISELK